MALCPTRHHRIHNAESDRSSKHQDKANLGLVRNRYGELELRILEQLAIDALSAGAMMALPGGAWLLIERLVRDGFIERVELPDQFIFLSDSRRPFASAERITVALTARVTKELVVLRELTGLPKTDLVDRALSPDPPTEPWLSVEGR